MMQVLGNQYYKTLGVLCKEPPSIYLDSGVEVTNKLGVRLNQLIYITNMLVTQVGRLKNCMPVVGLPKTTSSDSPSKNLKGLIHAWNSGSIHTGLQIEKEVQCFSHHRLRKKQKHSLLPEVENNVKFPLLMECLVLF